MKFRARLLSKNGARGAMSALGQKQTWQRSRAMSALPPRADMCDAKRDVRFVPIADIGQCPLILLRPNISQRVSNARERALLKKWRFTAEGGLNCRKYDVHYGPLPRQPINHLSLQRGAFRVAAGFSQLQRLLSAFSSSL
jgi:hypothetical protein